MSKKKKKAARKSRQCNGKQETLTKLLIAEAILQITDGLIRLVDKLTD